MLAYYKDSRKSRKHGNHGRKPWFSPNAVFCSVLAKMSWPCVF